jgi:hypothetical protein
VEGWEKGGEVSKTTPPIAAVFIGLFYAIVVGFFVDHKAYSAAAAAFTYGLALALGCIYQVAKRK